jgi:NAD(P)-dependent dehydrogenase (short-subunit alcohol dehydrogenase family)
MATVVVTGASRGLGLELVRQYAAEGHGVVACCREPALAKGLKQVADQSDGRVSIHEVDVTDLDHVQRLASDLAGQTIDVLINNAGIYPKKSETFGQVDAEAWMRTFRVNTIAPLRVAEVLVEHVARSQRKVIANMSSLMGSIGDNDSGGSYAYRTSKAALNMATVSMARDLAPRGITCVCLHPGWVKTDMGGAGAPIEAADSVRGLKKVLDRLSPADNGKFFDHEGDTLPW